MRPATCSSARYSRRIAVRFALMVALGVRDAIAVAAREARPETLRAPRFSEDIPALLPDDSLDALMRSIHTDAVSVRLDVVEAPGFDRVLRLQTNATPSPYAEGEYTWTVFVPITMPVKRGDVLEATFTARADGTPDAVALTRFVFERAEAPNTKSASEPVVLDTDWREHRFRFRSAEAYEPGEARIVFYLGYEPQAFVIGGLSVVNVGRNAVIPPPTYDGREPDAAWRDDAAARIEQRRKGDLSVTVVDQGGNGIAGAAVHVAMRRHAFGFGSAVTGQRLLATDNDSAIYRETIARLYNQTVFENDLKWREWEGGSPARAALDRLRGLGIAVRGHTLVWPRWAYMPDDVYALRNDLPRLRKRVDTHIADEVGAFAGQLVAWDVLNEPYANHDLIDVLGVGEMARWFQLAAQADPTPPLFLNDADFFEARGEFRRKQDYYARLIPTLLDAGAPLSGIGMQSHFDARLPPIPRVLAILDRFAVFGLPIAITELDIDMKDEQAQADFLGDFMTAAFSHPAVSGIIMWGFWEGQHWLPDAALYRRDWSRKPNGAVWEDLVTRQWWTDITVRTDTDGKATIRGFLGEYRVTASIGERTSTVTATLPADGASIAMTV